eukprot:snap_masked-scaffold_28-processed-gene-4.9-mRNA-1 protein AED:1.00 eAED:1.00 QI:0/-1/0/0/-1/1/1/0/84
MHQIGEVSKPIGLWPRKVLQWVDDSVIMGDTVDELYNNLEKILNQSRSRKLHLLIDKFESVAISLTFCGGSFDADGWKFDIQYS